MRRRLVASNLALILIVLFLLEVPLALVYSRHEHDALTAELQRDASSLGALSEEIIEHPGGHDVAALAARFSNGVGGDVVILDKSGVRLTGDGPAGRDKAFAAALLAARAGRAGSGERGGLSYATVTVGAPGERGGPPGDGRGAISDSRGAVLVARPDEAIDHRVRGFWVLLLLIGGGVLAVSVLVSDRLARWAIDPLHELDEHAADLGRGELSVRAQATAGPPEVVALAETFNLMADRLDALVSSQRRFVADASHQLRTPLTAIRLRLENMDAHDPQSVSMTRDVALVETVRLSRLVDGLLALAAAEGRRPQREAVDIVAVVRHRHHAWEPLAAERGVHLSVEPADRSVISALVVPGHVEQILDNLIDNALEASQAGNAVRLTVDAVGSSVEVGVTDEGVGMTDEERLRAFDPFWQGAGTKASGGTGLGLAIVDQLVRASGGTIVLESNATGGTAALIRFPHAPSGTSHSGK